MDHVGQGRLAAVKHPVQVDPQHLPPVCLGDVREQFLPGNARVAYQYIQGVKVPEKGRRHLPHFPRSGHVAGVQAHRDPQLPELLRQGLGPGLGSVVVDSHPITLPGKQTGSGRPDAPGGSGDEHGFSLRH